MSSNQEKFNFVIDEFLCKLINSFNSEKLKKYRRYFKLISAADKELPALLFMVGCIKYKEKIASRDETFFTKNEEVTEKAKMFGNFTEDCGLNEYWQELSNETKISVWEYLQTLFVLADMVSKKNPERYNKFNSFYLSDFKNDIENINNKFSLDFLSKLNS